MAVGLLPPSLSLVCGSLVCCSLVEVVLAGMPSLAVKSEQVENRFSSPPPAGRSGRMDRVTSANFSLPCKIIVSLLILCVQEVLF